jgi:hypothetical protein
MYQEQKRTGNNIGINHHNYMTGETKFLPPWLARRRFQFARHDFNAAHTNRRRGVPRMVDLVHQRIEVPYACMEGAHSAAVRHPNRPGAVIGEETKNLGGLF